MKNISKQQKKKVSEKLDPVLKSQVQSKFNANDLTCYRKYM